VREPVAHRDGSVEGRKELSHHSPAHCGVHDIVAAEGRPLLPLSSLLPRRENRAVGTIQLAQINSTE